MNLPIIYICRYINRKLSNDFAIDYSEDDTPRCVAMIM